MSYFIDVQGTLIDDQDKRPIKGAIEFIRKLNEEGTPYCLITNNTKLPSRQFLRYLQELGFEVDEKRYIDPLMVLTKVIKDRRVAAYGVEGFLRSLEGLGFRLDYEDPEAVILSVKDDYTFEEFGDIDEFLLGGAKLVGMHATSLYAKAKRYPGVGALLAMFEFATGAKPLVVGKPSELFFKEALAKVGGDFSQVTIISDDPKGDLAGAKRLGMKSVLVLSGKVRSEEEAKAMLEPKEYPDMVVADIGELL